MKEEEINKAIAEWSGKLNHSKVEDLYGIMRCEFCNQEWPPKEPFCNSREFEKFTQDLNACHRAENKLLSGASGEIKREWCEHLTKAATLGATSAECATAHQRCEALLRTIGKWVEQREANL